MEAITLLGGIKLLIDIFEENWLGVATGVLLSGVPGSEFYTLGDSMYYMFDMNGNYVGTKDVSNIPKISFNEINISNEDEARIAFKKAQAKISFQKKSDSIGFNKKSGDIGFNKN